MVSANTTIRPHSRNGAGQVFNVFAMLKFILTCALVGGLIGLVLSHSGEGERGFT